MLSKINHGTIALHYQQHECAHLGDCYIDNSPFFTAQGLARVTDVRPDPEYPDTGVMFYIEPYVQLTEEVTEMLATLTAQTAARSLYITNDHLIK